MARSNKSGLKFGLIVASFLCTAFGNSLQPISVLAWLQPLFALLAFHSLHDGVKSPLRNLLTTTGFILIQSVAGCIAFASAFGYPKSTVTSVATAFGLALFFWAGTTVGAIWAHWRFEARWPTSPLLPVVYPILSTAINSLISLSVGTYAITANALLDITPFAQCAALFGLAGLSFLSASTATIKYLHLTTAYFTSSTVSDQALASKQIKNQVLWRHTNAVVVACIFLGTAGSALRWADSWYQRDIAELIQPRLQASCVLGQNAAPGSPAWERLWDRTQAHVQAGDDIVLWAEESARVVGEAEEQLLVNKARSLAASTNRSFIGVGYERHFNSSGKSLNLFVLIAPDGSIAWNYSKAYPVPLVEASIMPGDKVMPVYDAPFGRLGGAICFDLDHPPYLLQASRHKVDIVLQPSWTWGSIGIRHWAGDQLRAVENGVTIVRCSSMGVSGVVSPRGIVWGQLYTSGDDQVTFSFPKQAHLHTVYAGFGFVLEWFNLTAAVILWLLLFVPKQWVVDAQRQIRGRAAAGATAAAAEARAPLLEEGQVDRA